MGDTSSFDSAIRSRTGYAGCADFIRGETRKVYEQVAPFLTATEREMTDNVFFAWVPALGFNAAAFRFSTGEITVAVSLSLILMHAVDVHFYRALGYLDRIRPILKGEKPSVVRPKYLDLWDGALYDEP